MRRRGFIALFCGAAAWPLAARAQPQRTDRLYRIGVFSPDEPLPGLLEAFRDGLRELGYVEGRNFSIELRNAKGDNAALASLAQELVRHRVDVILAINTQAVHAAKAVTSEIPIVMTRVADPVKTGLVTSLSRPGGNVTGLSFIPDALSGKRLELLKEALPEARRVAALWYSGNPGAQVIAREMEPVRSQLGLDLIPAPVSSAADLSRAFRAAAQGGAEAVIVVDDAVITKHRADFISFAHQHRLPIIALWRDFAEAGALIAYGPSTPVMHRRAAQYVDKVLKGAKPSDLPVEQPTTFELFVNLKTAKAFGLSIPAG